MPMTLAQSHPGPGYRARPMGRTHAGFRLSYYRHALMPLTGGLNHGRRRLTNGARGPVGPEQTAELLRRARGGDRAAMNALFQRLGPPLQRWAQGRLPGWARGMVSTVDLVQETLFSTFRALEKHSDADHDFAIHAYVRTSLKSRLVDELRKVQRRPALGEMKASVGSDTESPVEAAVGAEALARYESALAGLDPVSRDAVIARLELNLPWEDIARLSGKGSADAARMSVSRALLKVAEAMADD